MEEQELWLARRERQAGAGGGRGLGMPVRARQLLGEDARHVGRHQPGREAECRLEGGEGRRGVAKRERRGGHVEMRQRLVRC
jgi:hypothetical protein